MARANGRHGLSGRRLPVGLGVPRAGAPLIALTSALALVVLAVSVASAAQTRAAVAQTAKPPLPASDYAVRSVCAQPAGPLMASCLALRLVPLTAAARAHTHLLGAMSAGAPPAPGRGAHPAGDAAAGLYGLRPQDLHAAYDLPTSAVPAKGQTIALVDAYDDPHAEGDLAAYDREFGLPECIATNGCFRKLDEEGRSSPLPAAEGEWAMEISLDIETAHAICSECRIRLIEASSPSYADLEAAEREAVALGATEISNSWGGEEPASDSEAFDHPGVVITAASGLLASGEPHPPEYCTKTMAWSCVWMARRTSGSMRPSAVMVNQSALPPPTISPASRPDKTAPEIPATIRCPVGEGPAFTARSTVMAIVHSGTRVINARSSGATQWFWRLPGAYCPQA